MKKWKRLAALVLAGALLVPFAGCAKEEGSSVDRAKKNGEIILATNAAFEPFEYKEGSEYKGIDLVISQKIADKLGVKLTVHDVEFKTVVEEVKSGKADFAAAGMSIDEERKQQIDFSDPYFDASQAIIVRNGSDIKSRADLNGKRVGVQEGTTGDEYCKNEKGENDVVVGETVRYSKGMEAVADLIKGRLDAVIIDDFPATKLVQKNSNDIVKLEEALTTEQYAIGIRKGDAEMLKLVNEILAEMKSSGELAQLIESYKSALGAE